MARRRRSFHGKPRIPAPCVVWLERAFARFRLDYHHPSQVVSDVWDGWATREEIRPLVRCGFVSEFKLLRDERTSVSAVTWELTEWGLFWFRRWRGAS